MAPVSNVAAVPPIEGGERRQTSQYISASPTCDWSQHTKKNAEGVKCTNSHIWHFFLPRFSLDKLRKPFPAFLRNSSSSSIPLSLRIKPPSSSASSFSPSPLGGCSGNFHPPPLVLFFLPCLKSLLKFLDQKGDRGAQEESFLPVKSHHVIMMTDCSSIFCLDMRHTALAAVLRNFDTQK